MCILIGMSKKKRNSLDPLQLSNLVLYLDANRSLSGSAQDAPVSSWTDLSSNGYNQLATLTTRPLVMQTVNGSPSGKTLVRFDGVDDQMSSSGPVAWPTGVNGHTFYFYGRLKAAASFALLFSDTSIGRPQIGYEKALNSLPYVRSEADGTAVKNLHSANIFDTKMQLLCVVFKTDGTVQAYQALSNGTLTALDQNPTYTLNGGESGIAFGASVLTASGFITADIASVIWCNVAHSTTTINGVRNYMKNIYGED